MTRDKYKYETVPGFFVHDDPSIIPGAVGALPEHFGLLDSHIGIQRWKLFKERISNLNLNAIEGKCFYKVFFLGRHGQGYHNVAEAKYGTKAWDDYWSKLETDGELIWGPDPPLTNLGEQQASEAHELWQRELSQAIVDSDLAVPFPDRIYSSPLTRAMRTCEVTFSGLVKTRQKTVVIVENCREENGIHTCDKRSSKTSILSKFPTNTSQTTSTLLFETEQGFTEEDELWLHDERESKSDVAMRARLVLDKIFDQDKDASYISITAHGGIINGFLAALGRKPYALPTGGILPVVVKAILNDK